MANNTTAGFGWWQTGVVYQIYPRSFMDSNGDGIGDLLGIIQRLDYLSDTLGVDAIWISPIYPSPMYDFGYDVSDYCAIHPMFGNMMDFDQLLAETHKRGMRLILDLVPNHTSDEHAWFVESRSSRDNPKRNWYFWRDPAPDGGPPNNWLSCFGGSGWQFDTQTGQYYLHTFAKQQPDLDFRNPQVVDAMLDAMRFWLDKGVDGFRVDVITGMIKDQQLRDEPENPDWDGVDPYARLQHVYSSNLPEVHAIVRQMRALIDSYPDRVLIGEIFALPNEELVKYYGAHLDECHLPFNFSLIWIPWTLSAIQEKITAYMSALPPGAWPNWVLGNHDQPRIATRAGRDQARVASMLLLTLRGTPTCYYGDELGMENVSIPPDLVQDPPAVNQPEIAHIVGRDPERTPMQWDATSNAGFSADGVRTWLPLSADYMGVNVAKQLQKPTSMLAFHRALLRLRRSEAALTVGGYQPVDVSAAQLCAYLRSHDTTRILVVLNFGAEAQRVDLSAVAHHAELLLSTEMTTPRLLALANLELGPNEGMVLRLAS